MIASLEGTITYTAPDHVVIVVGGVGYKVFVPANSFANIGETAVLYTNLIVREDSLTLYGFASITDKEMFERLITVNGIGPKLAVTIIGVLPIAQLYQAVSTNQPELLMRVPGIGRKTAEKIILELKDKLKGGDGLIATIPFDDVDKDVLDALVSLGYSLAEAQAALRSLPPDTAHAFDERLRRALQYFV